MKNHGEYFQTNEDWFMVKIFEPDEIGVTIFLTDMAPQEAVDSYNEW